MKLNDLKPASGSKKSRRRVGRGLGSGRGKTAGRGQKGQSSRSGFSQGAGWEGGRSRLIMRLPKRGFSREKELFQLVNLEDLNVFEAGATVDAEVLAQRGIIRHADRPVKLLGRGTLEISKLQIDVDAFSRSAARAVAAAGGSVRGANADGEADEDATPTKKTGGARTRKAGAAAAKKAETKPAETKPAGKAKAKKAKGEAEEGSTEEQA
jgi:large subunit ribosomal protein L15